MMEVVMNECLTYEIHSQAIEEVKSKQLSQETYRAMTSLLKMISDPSRLKICHALFLHDLCVCDLQEICGMSQSALSHQLYNLRLARLVTSQRKGKNIIYSLADDHVKKLFEVTYEHVMEQV